MKSALSVLLAGFVFVALISRLAAEDEKPKAAATEKTAEKAGDKEEPPRERYDGADKPLDPQQATLQESKFFINPKQLTNEGQSGEGYFSPDGKRVIFQSIRGDHPFYQIYIKDLPTGQEKRVSTGKGRTTCAFFHPTENKIIYASSHLDPNRDAEADKEIKKILEARKNPGARRGYSWAFDPFMDIFELNLDTNELKQLTSVAGYDAEGSYSHDGKKIVFSTTRNGAGGDLYIMDADGGNQKQLTNSPGYDGGPFFSPDDKRIIFRGEVRKRDYLQLFVINADGTGEWQLTDNDSVNWGPFWNPNNKHIIYATSTFGGHMNYELALLHVETGKSKRVTFMWGADVLPVFSPDGKKLMWTSKRGKDKDGNPSSQLWIADWVGELEE
jgi:Tol biopolymer transport system component